MDRIEKGNEILARGRKVLEEGRKAVKRLDKILHKEGRAQWKSQS